MLQIGARTTQYKLTIVHHGEEALLVFAAVPGPHDHRQLPLYVERHGDLAVEAVLAPLVVGQGAGVDDREVRLRAAVAVAAYALVEVDEHVLHEVLLPRELGEEPDAPAAVGARTDEAVVDLD